MSGSMLGVGVTETGQLSSDARPSAQRRAARRRRSDAVRNAEKVFAAALEVCATAGLAVTLPEVASRAGVGRTTVYRSFASRDELIAAVMGHKLRQLAERVAAASRRDNEWEGLRDLLILVMGDVREDRLLGDALLLRSDLFPDDPILATLLQRGQAQGVIAPGITGLDLRLMVSGVAHSLVISGERDPRAWTRAAEWIANAACARLRQGEHHASSSCTAAAARGGG
jgi:AcrR family transcriptional regulator